MSDRDDNVVKRTRQILTESDLLTRFGLEPGRQVAKALAKKQVETMEKTPSKTAASAQAAKYLKARKGRRPIRAETLLKKTETSLREEKTASDAGQDLRLPILGGTKYPTNDSKQPIQSHLAKSKRRAEVGPTPTLARLKPTGPKVSEIVPTFDQNLMPKVSAAMSSLIENDPLVRYLSKIAAEDAPPKKVTTGESGALPDNKEDMPTSKSDSELVSSPPEMPDELESQGQSQWKRYLQATFDHARGITEKNKAKDHAPTKGSVDKVLKKH